jgi:hypothetical protein
MTKSNKFLLYRLLLLAIIIFIVWVVYRKSCYEGFVKKILTKGLILTLISGLGNQLFVYAAALSFQKTFNVPVFLIVDGSTKAHIKQDYIPLMDGLSFIDGESPIVKNAIEFNFKNNEPYHTYNEYEIPVDDPSYIKFGIHYFQSYEKIKDVIGKVKESVILKCRDRYNTLNIKSDSSAFIHIRRGDYLTDTGGKRMISPDFYMKGLEILNKSDRVDIIYICSDDIPWCKKQKWDTSKRVVFFDDPDELKTLYLMSKCWAGAVISNSTFSLWGVFLGAYKKTDMIVYPSTQYFLKDLPEKWIKI